MTYPRHDVQEALGQFELVRVSLADREPEARSLIKRYRTLWSPGFVLLDLNETELRRFLGFQQGPDFVAELRVGLGKVHLLHRRAEQAYTALFQQEKKSVDWLREYWSELGERFPDSRWWTAADVWEGR